MTIPSCKIPDRIACLLAILFASPTIASCGDPPRVATVPLPPDDAVTRAAHVLESFDYTVVDLDREEGIVRGTRDSGNSRGVLWEVRVHVRPESDGSAARYRLESRATATVDTRRRRSSDSDLPYIRFNEVPSSHLDEILATLADWRRAGASWAR
ncbi:MAG: hypothetical protein R3223_09980 [Longimicrobiales bacterium]|nr:hypothetical protein [Longimicrobiales bacterium]